MKIRVTYYVHKTVLVKLKIKDSDKPRIQNTFSDYKIAWQHVSYHVFNSKCRNRSKVHHATYQQVRNLVPNLSSALVQEARNDAIAKAKSAKSNGHKLETAPKLKNISIRFDKRTASIKGNIISFAANGGKRIIAEFENFDFLDKHRTYKTLAPVIFNKDGQYWAALTFDVTETPVKPGSILGLDMGLRVLVATSDGKLIRGTKLNKLRRKTRFNRAGLQRKGTRSARRRLRLLSRLEKRQSRDVIHCAVNEVLKTPATVIAVEDLDLRSRKYRKASNRRRFSMPISEFLRILEYKARLCGKQVAKVKPEYTSQDDCRGLSPGSRIGGKYVGQDGFVMQSDINAACNIAIRAKKSLALNNPVSVCYLNRQAPVNEPIAYKSRSQDFVSQAAIPLG
jgi:IS605 OrfB family transposase